MVAPMADTSATVERGGLRRCILRLPPAMATPPLMHRPALCNTYESERYAAAFHGTRRV
jgi:hypothetical protein